MQSLRSHGPLTVEEREDFIVLLYRGDRGHSLIHIEACFEELYPENTFKEVMKLATPQGTPENLWWSGRIDKDKFKALVENKQETL